MSTVVWAQEWWESERNWGQRPDGWSLHTTKASVELYIRTYWEALPSEAPDEYSFPVGDSFLVEISDEAYALVSNTPFGVRHYGKEASDF